MVTIREYRVNGYENLCEFLKLFYKFDKKLRFRGVTRGLRGDTWDGW